MAGLATHKLTPTALVPVFVPFLFSFSIFCTPSILSYPSLFSRLSFSFWVGREPAWDEATSTHSPLFQLECVDCVKVLDPCYLEMI